MVRLSSCEIRFSISTIVSFPLRVVAVSGEIPEVPVVETVGVDVDDEAVLFGLWESLLLAGLGADVAGFGAVDGSFVASLLLLLVGLGAAAAGFGLGSSLILFLTKLSGQLENKK